MLLVIDVGNTNTVLGVYSEENLLADWRLETRKHSTADEYGILIKDLFHLSPLAMEEVKGISISCVVPPLSPVLERMSQKYFGIKPLMIGPGIKTGMPILYDNPREVGADRIVNSVAAYEKYGGPVIVVDFGTATTFDAISKEGEYLGGVISPGIMISIEALFEQASKLPRIELVKPKTVIGKNTVSSMQSGLIYGYVGLVSEIVARAKKEMGGKPYVVATGGLAGIIAQETDSIDAEDPYLTLEGLRIIYIRNRGEY